MKWLSKIIKKYNLIDRLEEDLAVYKKCLMYSNNERFEDYLLQIAVPTNKALRKLKDL